MCVCVCVCVCVSVSVCVCVCVCVSIRPVCWRAAWLSSEEGPAVWEYGLLSPGSYPLRPSPHACSSSWPSPCYNRQSIFARNQEQLYMDCLAHTISCQYYQ